MKNSTIESIPWPIILFSMSCLMKGCGYGGGGGDSCSAGQSSKVKRSN